jgi:hypothetical protein
MNAIRIVLVITLLATGRCLVAQVTASATDYFNKAARQYVQEDKVSALRTLEKGLQQYPGDPRLLKLADELLKEEQDQQQQQDRQQDQQNEQGKEEENKDQGGNKEEQKQDEKSEEQQNKEQRPQEQRPGRISPQDADRMLDAMDQQEKSVQEKVRTKQRPVPRTPVEKDW